MIFKGFRQFGTVSALVLAEQTVFSNLLFSVINKRLGLLGAYFYLVLSILFELACFLHDNLHRATVFQTSFVVVLKTKC